MRPTLYAFYNSAGHPLRVVSQILIDREPLLASRLLPLPPYRNFLSPYRLLPDVPLARRLYGPLSEGEMAWLFYPGRRDRVETVFLLRDERCYVVKRVYKRIWRGLSCPFHQLELPPAPLIDGVSVADKLRQLVIKTHFQRGKNVRWGSVKRLLYRFFAELLKQFPLDERGKLPPNALEAIPRNCMIDRSGRYRFFDLEYDLKGGVPPSLLVYRALKSDVVSSLKKDDRDRVLELLYREICTTLHFKGDLRQSMAWGRRLKRFNTGSFARLFATPAISLLPKREWRMKLQGWSETIDLKQRAATPSRALRLADIE